MGSLAVEKRVRMVVKPIIFPHIGLLFADTSRILVCDDFGVKASSWIVLVLNSVPPVGGPSFRFIFSKIDKPWECFFKFGYFFEPWARTNMSKSERTSDKCARIP